MRPRSPLRVPAACCVLALLVVAPLESSGAGRDYERKPRNPDYAAALKEIKKEDYSAAIPHLKRAASAKPKDADVQNLLGFTHRKTGRLDEAEAYYREALRLDPKHKRAHEYLGELYLQRGDLDRAEQQLATLDDLCWLPCSEKRKLQKSIEAYRASLTATE